MTFMATYIRCDVWWWRISCTATPAAVSAAEPYLAGSAVGGRPGVTGATGSGWLWSSSSTAAAGADPGRPAQAPPAHTIAAPVITPISSTLKAAPSARDPDPPAVGRPGGPAHGLPAGRRGARRW